MFYSILIKIKFIFFIFKDEIKDFIVKYQINFIKNVYLWDLNKLKVFLKIKRRYFCEISIQNFFIFCLLNILLLAVTLIYSCFSVILIFFLVDLTKFLILKEFYYNFIRGGFYFFIVDLLNLYISEVRPVMNLFYRFVVIYIKNIFDFYLINVILPDYIIEKSTFSSFFDKVELRGNNPFGLLVRKPLTYKLKVFYLLAGLYFGYLLKYLLQNHFYGFLFFVYCIIVCTLSLTMTNPLYMSYIFIRKYLFFIFLIKLIEVVLRGSYSRGIHLIS